MSGVRYEDMLWGQSASRIRNGTLSPFWQTHTHTHCTTIFLGNFKRQSRPHTFSEIVHSFHSVWSATEEQQTQEQRARDDQRDNISKWVANHV